MTAGMVLVGGEMALAGWFSGRVPGLRTLCMVDPNPPTVPNLQALQVRVARVELHVVDREGAGDSSLPYFDSSYERDAVWCPGAVDKPMAWTGVTGEDGAVESGTIMVPEGRLNQVRVTVDLADAHSLTVDNQACELVLGAVNKVTATERYFKIAEPFRGVDVYRNTRTELLLALDPAASLVQTKNCWGLDPYLRIARLWRNNQELAVN